jgi:hypothetical protein
MSADRNVNRVPGFCLLLGNVSKLFLGLCDGRCAALPTVLILPQFSFGHSSHLVTVITWLQFSFGYSYHLVAVITWSHFPFGFTSSSREETRHINDIPMKQGKSSE